MEHLITVACEDPYADDARTMLAELSDELCSITGSSGKASFDISDVLVENARFIIARGFDGSAVGCGAFRPLENGIAEIKRMYSRRFVPGIGSALLKFLELEAQKLGYSALWLETRVVNVRAMHFYERHGYHRIANYGKYIGKTEAACFEKKLILN